MLPLHLKMMASFTRDRQTTPSFCWETETPIYRHRVPHTFLHIRGAIKAKLLLIPHLGFYFMEQIKSMISEKACYLT